MHRPAGKRNAPLLHQPTQTPRRAVITLRSCAMSDPHAGRERVSLTTQQQCCNADSRLVYGAKSSGAQHTPFNTEPRRRFNLGELHPSFEVFRAPEGRSFSQSWVEGGGAREWALCAKKRRQHVATLENKSHYRLGPARRAPCDRQGVARCVAAEHLHGDGRQQRLDGEALAL